MSLYAIGDTHLSQTANKPMNIFGTAWENHADKLKAAFSCLRDDDLTIICGDLSWGIDLEECLADFKLIDSFPF